MDLDNKLIVGVLVISMIFIMVGHIYKDQVQSILKQPLFELKNKIVFDWWSVTHLLLWSFIGFVKPNHPLSAFTFGIAFEILEDALSSNKNTQLVKCPNKGPVNKIMCNGVQDGFWYGKADDLFSNIVGYIIGNSIRTTFYPGLIIK